MKYISIILSLLLGAPLLAVEKRQTKKPSIGSDSRPSRKPFPLHWGKPPEIQTRDLVPLLAGFGRGSSTLAKWIVNNIKKDKEKVDERPNKPKPKPKPRPRPKPSAEIQAKIDVLVGKKKAMDVERRKLHNSFKGKSKEEIKDLVKSFRDAQKEKHEAIKKAQQELIKSVREKRQTGDRRE